MGLFLATHINKLDKKGRISIPATFRSSLISGEAQQFVAFRSYKYQAIECCTMLRMQQLSETMDQLDMFSEAQDDFTAAIFADAQPISIDGDGRAVLPLPLIEYAGLEESAAFIGRGATFQIWKPELFEEHQALARQRIKAHHAAIKLNKREDAKRI
jgi:MraZ protein